MNKINEVKKYYSQTIKKSSDLKTNACCTVERPPKHILDALNNIHPDIIKTYYGCGLIIPDHLEGLTILDLGCGSGHDVYLLSQFVGENGKVIGVDMTDEQLIIAQNYEKYHQTQFGYRNKNTKFIKGYIEDLEEISSDTIDIVVSNCVINLSANKQIVFDEIFRVLKEGGEFYFSDVYASQRMNEELQNDSMLWGECLSGALYWNDFLSLVKKIGFLDPRLVKSNQIIPTNDKLAIKMATKLTHIKFYSATYRLFKLAGLEPDCENYDQKVIYKGTIPYNENEWKLDEHHIFPVDTIYDVCGNTYNMLYKSRFNKHFEFIDSNVHIGIFPGCGKDMPFTSTGKKSCC
jgi:arsenite methyltransferase